MYHLVRFKMKRKLNQGNFDIIHPSYRDAHVSTAPLLNSYMIIYVLYIISYIYKLYIFNIISNI